MHKSSVKKQIVLFGLASFIAALAVGCSSSSELLQENSEYRTEVALQDGQAKRVLVRFALPEDSTYSWFAGDTRPFGLEQCWFAEIPRNEGHYLAGVFQYKVNRQYARTRNKEDLKPRQGSLNELLILSQKSILLSNPDLPDDYRVNGPVVGTTYVNVDPAQKHLLISITDPRMAQQLFSGRPETLTLRSKINGHGWQSYRIPVTYREQGTE